MQSEIGAELQVTSAGLKSRKRESYAPAHIAEEWKALERAWPELNAGKRAERYEALEADVRGLIAHLGDTSGLILNPDLDSYHLMDATLVALPQTQTRLRQMRSFNCGLDVSKPLNQASHSAEAVLAAQLKSDDMDRITGDFDTCLKEDGNFHGISPTLKPNLTQASQRYAGGSGALLKQMAEFEKAPNAAKQAALDSALDEAIASSYALETTAIGELDRLLDYRVGGRYIALEQALRG